MPDSQPDGASPPEANGYAPRMTDIAAGERPRERLKRHGASTLRNDELLAIILRVGTRGENVMRLAERLLHGFRNLTGLLRADVSELSALHGMGESKAIQIKAALELGRRLSIESPEERPAVKSPSDAANLLSVEMAALEQEAQSRHQLYP